ncbi:MAG TPA: hypothetical protein VGF33_02800 [Caulobacteraceae bacterium]|jgi:hypothetical protein
MAEPDPNLGPQLDPAGDASAKVHELGRLVESGVERVRRLQHETHVLAQEQVELLARDMNAMAQRTAEISQGGDAYPVGVRELCSRMTDELEQQAKALTAIMERAPKL